MIPTIGRTVIFHGLNSNGSMDHPAMITKVFSGDMDTKSGAACVNLTVFPDGCLPLLRSAVMLYDTRERALASSFGNSGGAAFWPERI